MAAEYDAEKNRALLNGVFEDSCEAFSDKVSSLLGYTIQFSGVKPFSMTAQDVFDGQQEKTVVGQLSFRSAEDEIGQGAIVRSAKDAITLGSLLMISQAEQGEAVLAGELSDEVKSAYGEVFIGISGLCGKIFAEEYAPVKAEVVGGEVFVLDAGGDPDVLVVQHYCSLAMSASLEEKTFGELQILLPADVLQLSNGEAGIAAKTAV